MSDPPSTPDEGPEQVHHAAAGLATEDAHLRWWHRALLASATGFLFSVLLNLFVAIGLMLHVPPVVALERIGIEEGMRLAWAFNPYLPQDHPSDLRFLFLDVDPAACRHYRPDDPGRCRTEPLIGGALAADAILWARRSGAKGIVLDSVPFTDPEDRALFRKAALQPGAWIIAPLAGRPDRLADTTVFNRRPDKDVIDGVAQGPVRLASFDADADAADLTLRHYRHSMRTRLPADESPGWSAPTVGYLMAALGREGTGSAVDCRYYSAVCHRPEMSAGAAHGTGHEQPPGHGHEQRGAQAHEPKTAHGNDGHGAENEDEGLSRIAFSLPTIALAGSQAQQDRLAARYETIYTRLSAGDLLVAGGGQFAPQPDSVRDRIVVIGSSAAVSQDWAATPIGAMSGPEFLINVARSFSAQSNTGHHAPGQDWLTPLAGLWPKTIASARGAVIMTVAWLAIFAIIQNRHGRRGRGLHLAADAAIVLIFLIGMSVVALAEIYFLARHASEGLLAGHFVDVLTPVLALGGEGFAEAAIVVIARIEGAIETAAHRARHQLSALLGKFR